MMHVVSNDFMYAHLLPFLVPKYIVYSATREQKKMKKFFQNRSSSSLIQMMKTERTRTTFSCCYYVHVNRKRGFTLKCCTRYTV
jgi:hypothetical protein